MLLHTLIIFVIAAGLQVTDGQAVKPYMGWSSWSLQATTMPGYGATWLKEDNILRQIDTMADSLKEFGYTYVNMDSGKVY